VDGAEMTVIRDRESYQDLIRGERVLPEKSKPAGTD
jgi:hypothetical protein